jgi:enamine deaminase RidA (YjgF/YER057c/UK114 family)
MSVTIHKPGDVHAEPGLYTHAFSSPLQGRRLVVVSGQLGIRPDGSIYDDFEGQFHQTYANLRAVLHDVGGDLTDIVSLRTYLSYAGLLPTFHELRRQYYPELFGEVAPPNTLLVVSQLYRPDLWLEIEALALLGS